MESSITIRPATDDDEAFLLGVYASTRIREVAAFGWVEEQQQAFLEMQFSTRRRAYAMQYPDAKCSIVLSEGVPAGEIIVDRSGGRIELTDIAILPEFRGRGIASRLIRELQNEAAAAGWPLTLSVDRANVNALNLYSKLGFTVTGETELNLAMEWTAPKMDNPLTITLRPVTADDREFLLAVYASSREIELSMVPWDDEQKRAFVVQQFDAQTAYYAETYPDAAHDIIEADGTAAGRLYVDRRFDEVAILDVAVLPEFRRRGIGTSVVRGLQDGADGRTVSVYVEGFNPSLKLFERLGFTPVSNDGVNFRLEWRSDPGSSSASSR